MIDPNWKSTHWKDENDNPAGGSTFGAGFAISWQNGPLGRGANREDPNGTFVETILAAARDRLKFYQESKFNCQENAYAITHISAAIDTLNVRTADREARQVEGTHAT